ncbi:hypothetical protein KL86PLE_70182 [uncultured Pleomorphomonas sp.]|uniref:Uncharacterized protein n=1 Tax=uncultured Pleomorphomonas sp. TaxID=442121 RepID=A0A212LLR2_9HYPH|nr:hypothetical protein KL86PLE_70182 [uncultured Pleomorphomonas sp.]
MAVEVDGGARNGAAEEGRGTEIGALRVLPADDRRPDRAVVDDVGNAGDGIADGRRAVDLLEVGRLDHRDRRGRFLEAATDLLAGDDNRFDLDGIDRLLRHVLRNGDRRGCGYNADYANASY